MAGKRHQIKDEAITRYIEREGVGEAWRVGRAIDIILDVMELANASDFDEVVARGEVSAETVRKNSEALAKYLVDEPHSSVLSDPSSNDTSAEGL